MGSPIIQTNSASGFLQNGKQLAFQLRQRLPHGIPDHIQINVEITVSHTVAHSAHLSPRNIRVTRRPFRVVVSYLSGGFSNHKDIEYYRLLRFLVGDETSPLMPST